MSKKEGLGSVSFVFFWIMAYTVVFDETFLDLGEVGEPSIVMRNNEVRKHFYRLETMNQYLNTFEDWELEAYNLRVERFEPKGLLIGRDYTQSDYCYDPVVPF